MALTVNMIRITLNRTNWLSTGNSAGRFFAADPSDVMDMRFSSDTHTANTWHDFDTITNDALVLPANGELSGTPHIQDCRFFLALFTGIEFSTLPGRQTGPPRLANTPPTLHFIEHKQRVDRGQPNWRHHYLGQSTKSHWDTLTQGTHFVFENSNSRATIAGIDTGGANTWFETDDVRVLLNNDATWNQIKDGMLSALADQSGDKGFFYIDFTQSTTAPESFAPNQSSTTHTQAPLTEDPSGDDSWLWDAWNNFRGLGYFGGGRRRRRFQ